MNNDTALIALAHACEDPKKGFRPTLQAINFTGSHAHATDGFMLASLEYELVKPGILKSEFIKSFKPKTEVLALEERKVISLNGVTKTIGELTETFPSVSRVQKHKGDNTHLRIGLSIEVLSKIVTIMKKNNDSHILLEFDSDNMKPIYGELKNGLELTIMPYRVN